MTRVLVCGGRKYRDMETLFRVLDEQHAKARITAVIHGAALGADWLAKRWALNNRVPEWPYPANWTGTGRKNARMRINGQGQLYDPAAGAIRNAKMLKDGKPDLVIAFPGGNGTENMKMLTRRAGVMLIEVPR